jgi:hypothetical protein
VRKTDAVIPGIRKWAEANWPRGSRPRHPGGNPAFHPTVDQELLLQVVLAGPEIACSAWDQWNRLHPDAASADAACRRLMPMLHRRLFMLGIDAPGSAEFEQAYRYTWAANLRATRAASEAVLPLAAAGIPTMIIKGAALLALEDGDLGLRPMADVDLLVPSSAAARAEAVLESNGWVRRRQDPREIERLIRHGTAYARARQEVDLHWCALHLPGRDEPFWEAAVPARLGSVETLAPSRTDQLLIVLAHGSGPFGAPVQWVVDAVTLVRGNASIDWDRLVELSVSRGVALSVASALGYLQQGFAPEVPDSAIEALLAVPKPLHERLSNWATAHPPARGSTYVHQWHRWRMLKAYGSPAAASTGGEQVAVPPSFPRYVEWVFGLSTHSQLLARLARKAPRALRDFVVGGPPQR